MNIKKAISPVVATALLLVVAVTAVVSFQGWFATYSSATFTDVEQQSQIDSLIQVEGIIGDTLYLKSGDSATFLMLKITDLNGNTMCDIEDGTKSSLAGNTRMLLTFDDALATDLTGYGNNGTLNNGVSCATTGIAGNSCEFDGVDDYISLGNASELNNIFDGGGSISAWIYPTGMGEGNYGRIVDKGSDFSGTNGYYFTLFNSAPVESLCFRKDFTISDGYWNTPANSIVINQWQFVTLVYNSDSDANRPKMYINGIEQTLSMSMTPNGVRVSDDTQDLRIGNQGTIRTFQGKIDEVMLFSKELTDSEILSLYQSQKAKFYEQIITQGVKEIDISSCNLNKENVYDFVAFTNTGKIESKIIAK